MGLLITYQSCSRKILISLLDTDFRLKQNHSFSTIYQKFTLSTSLSIIFTFLNSLNIYSYHRVKLMLCIFALMQNFSYWQENIDCEWRDILSWDINLVIRYLMHEWISFEWMNAFLVQNMEQFCFKTTKLIEH